MLRTTQPTQTATSDSATRSLTRRILPPATRRIAVLLLVAQSLISACSITIGPPPSTTPGPGEPTNTPIEQVHFDVTHVPSPTAVPPTSTPGPGAAVPGATGKYTIKPGDTLSGIAQEFGITVEDLVKLNNITDPNQIQAGQVLTVPAKGAATSAPGPTASPTRGP
jgi:LysM repeat protein